MTAAEYIVETYVGNGWMFIVNLLFWLNVSVAAIKLREEIREYGNAKGD